VNVYLLQFYSSNMDDTPLGSKGNPAKYQIKLNHRMFDHHTIDTLPLVLPASDCQLNVTDAIIRSRRKTVVKWQL
jgi:hypothetical protein